jgi:hypothetical protein
MNVCLRGKQEQFELDRNEGLCEEETKIRIIVNSISCGRERGSQT